MTKAHLYGEYRLHRVYIRCYSLYSCINILYDKCVCVAIHKYVLTQVVNVQCLECTTNLYCHMYSEILPTQIMKEVLLTCKDAESK